MDPLVWTILKWVAIEYALPVLAMLFVLAAMVLVVVQWLRNPRD